MAKVPNPVCSNESGSPKIKAIHIPNVSLGIGDGDYSADPVVTWKAGISPGPTAPRNLVVYNTTYQRGIEPILSKSEPRIWWIASDPSDTQIDYQNHAIEVISRLPERSVNDYELFATYSDAITWMRTNRYSIVNCDYPDILLGEDVNCETLINIEAGFSPSYDGLGVLYNLANPLLTTGFGSNPNAAPHTSHIVTNPANYSNQLFQGLGQYSGITVGSNAAIEHLYSAQTLNGVLDNGCVVECLLDVGSTGDFTLAQVMNPTFGGSEVAVVKYNSSASKFQIIYSGGVLESGMVSRPTGRHLFTFYIANEVVAGLSTSTLRIDDGSPIALNVAGGPVSFASSPNVIHFGGRANGPNWSEGVVSFFFARVHKASDGNSGEQAVITLSNFNYEVYKYPWGL